MLHQIDDLPTIQEIILHTLFESGSSKIQDLERYISDDIERYGARLTELDKKLVSAYTDLVCLSLIHQFDARILITINRRLARFWTTRHCSRKIRRRWERWLCMSLIYYHL